MLGWNKIRSEILSAGGKPGTEPEPQNHLGNECWLSDVLCTQNTQKVPYCEEGVFITISRPANHAQFCVSLHKSVGRVLNNGTKPLHVFATAINAEWVRQKL